MVSCLFIFLALLGNEENISDIWFIVKSVSISSEGQTVGKERFTCTPHFSSKVILSTYAAQMTTGKKRFGSCDVENRRWGRENRAVTGGSC